MYFKKLELLGFKSFAEKTTLHFEPGITAVVGPNGCGKCLKGDSLICLSDGSRVKIGELVENSLQNSVSTEKIDDGFMVIENPRNLQILSLNPENFKIEPRPIYAFIKRKAPAYLLEIKTKSGKGVVTTEYHPFFSLKDGQMIELKAEQLKEGVRISVPRQLALSDVSTKLDLMGIFRKFSFQDLVYVPYSEEIRELLSSFKESRSINSESAVVKSALNSALGGRQAINVAHLVSMMSSAGMAQVPECVNKLKSRGCTEILLPREMDVPLARFLGYVISGGRITKANQVWFVNEDKEVIKDFIGCARLAFGVEAKAFNYKEGAKDVLIFSHALCQFLEKAFGLGVESVSREKNIPEQIFSAGKEIIVEFLSSLFEGNGYISLEQINKRKEIYLEYTSASYNLAQGVSSLLLRLAVQSVIREKSKCATNTKKKNKKKYYSVYVYGLENVKILAGFLRFAGKKSEKLEKVRYLESKSNPNLDLIPEINGLIRELIKRAGIKVKRLRKFYPKLAAYYENTCLPSRHGLQEVLNVIAEHSFLDGLSKSIFNYIKSLSSSDVYWDEIVSIKKVYSEQWVYDLSVLGTHNFIAQDIIVHNSNIFDGIRWVLGEQSVKSLRGSKMEDVIFNGTENIPALGYAEVSLTFANENKALPIDYDEVTLTRRLFRSGESEYLINKTQVRLKDVVELFMGTGIGAESYSLIEQGKIDLILSSRPEDRRLVFDEAAGISRYKSQKRETARRLEDTEANLLRINDIIAELRRQINSLERQAAKARRYKELFDKLKRLETAVSALQIRGYQQRLDNSALELNALFAQEADDVRSIEELAQEQMRRHAEFVQLEQRLVEARAKAQEAENLISCNSQALGFHHERIGEFKNRLQAIETEVKELTARLLQNESDINNTACAIGLIILEINEKKAVQADSQNKLEEITKELHSLKTAAQQAKEKILEFASAEVHLNNQIGQLSSELNQAIARQKRLHIEKLKTEEEFKVAKNDLTAAGEREDVSHKKFLLLKEEYEQMSSTYASCLASCEAIKKRMQDLENERISLESQKEFLCNLKLKYENISESSNALVYLDSLSDTATTGMIVKIDCIEAISDADAKAPSRMRIRARGIAKPISLDPQAILKKIEDITAEIARSQKGLATETENIQALSGRLNASEEGFRLAEIEYNNLKTKKDNIQAHCKKLEDECALIYVESEDVGCELEKLKDNEARLKEEFAVLKNSASENQRAIERGLEETALKNSVREGLSLAIAQISAEISGSEERLSQMQKMKAVFEQAHSKEAQDLANLGAEENTLGNSLLEREASIRQVAERIEDYKNQKAILENEEKGFSLTLSKAKDGLKRAQDELSERKNILDAGKTQIHQLQMRMQELTFQQNSIVEKMQQLYKVSPEELKSQDALELQEINIEETVQEIELLKQKIESCGGVNLVAIEEFEGLKERFEFLNSQQADLLKSKESLQEAILKINRTAKKMFLETFAALAVEFKNYFRMLFGGGDAQLFLIDEQDVLESGIEIVCRPPGKKLQNVQLLSGGEKSMSAIALLFAIFKVRPSPFCVLDEVDAALDEANVDRFSRILVEFASQSQFIVITHNKKTIAHADIMYGITMEKAGVSRIVSVKLAENKVVNQRQEEVLEPALLKR
jgi:chromosome segregation protein